MNIILIGPPGAGKGTQARLLQDCLEMVIVSTGDILREEIKAGTEIGRQVEETIAAGRYPSEDIVLDVFEAHLKNIKGKNLILDGIPRTIYQAHKVEEIFDRLGLSIDAVIQIVVDDEELIHRLSNRIICKTCNAPYTETHPPHVEGVCDKCQNKEFIRRPDDEPEVIRTRLGVYNDKTKPLLNFYANKGLLRTVDGMKEVQEVKNQIETLLRDEQLLTIKSNCL